MYKESSRFRQSLVSRGKKLASPRLAKAKSGSSKKGGKYSLARRLDEAAKERRLREQQAYKSMRSNAPVVK
jgi:hypothetical protein